MEVVSSNFAAVLRQFRVLVRRCDFLAVDLEFTGLHSCRAMAASSADTHQARYLKARDSARHFAVLQLGVSLFTWVPSNGDQESDKDWDPVDQEDAPAAASTNPADSADSADSADFADFAKSAKSAAAAAASPDSAQSTSATDSDDEERDASSASSASSAAAGEGSWTVHPFNIYVMPSGDVKAQRVFTCEASALKFLSGHGFDFNKCVSKGVQFMSHADFSTRYAAQERQILSRATTGNKRSSIDVSTLRLDDQEFVDAVMASVRALSSSSSSDAGDAASAAAAAASGQTTAIASSSIVLEPCNAFRRRIVYQMVEEEFGDTMVVTKEPQVLQQRGLARLRVTLFPSAEAKDAYDQAKLQRNLAESRAQLDVAVGVRHIFDAISDSRKPVIGHNCYLDLAHIFEKFKGPLPDSVNDFTNTVHEHFPCVVDTKRLLSANPELNRKVRGRTSLGDAFSAMTAEEDEPDTPMSSSSSATTASATAAVKTTLPPFTFAEGFDAYKNSEARQHEAAYDAYMTGVVFANAAHALGMNAYDLKSWARAFSSVEVGEQELDKAAWAENKEDNVYGLSNELFLMRLGGASLRLGPLPQAELDRSLYVHVTGHPHRAQTGDFYRAFQDAGKGVRRVHWVDDDNLFLQMNDADGVAAALSRSFVKPASAPVDEDYDLLASLDGEEDKDASQKNHALGDLFDLQIQPYAAFQASLVDPPADDLNEAFARRKRARENSAGAEDLSSSKKPKTAGSDDSDSDSDDGEQEGENGRYCTI
jgi:hypothetical protein